jgi:hypothetical protein
MTIKDEQIKGAESLTTEGEKETPTGSSLGVVEKGNSADSGKKLGWGWKILSLSLSFVFTALVGGGAGYYAALSIPVPNQVVIYDLDKAMSTAANMAMKNGGDAQKIASDIVAAEKEKINEFKKNGIVVLDKSAVIDAPEYLFLKPIGEVEIAEIIEANKKPNGNENREVLELKAKIEELTKKAKTKE